MSTRPPNPRRPGKSTSRPRCSWRKQSRTLATDHTGLGATRRALLDHAWTGHARAVAAFLSKAVAAQLGHEMAAFVPFRYGARPRGHSCFGQIACRDLASARRRQLRSQVDAVVLARSSAVIAKLPRSDNATVRRPGSRFDLLALRQFANCRNRTIARRRSRLDGVGDPAPVSGSCCWREPGTRSIGARLLFYGCAVLSLGSRPPA
jgi:hypothetical protein